VQHAVEGEERWDTSLQSGKRGSDAALLRPEGLGLLGNRSSVWPARLLMQHQRQVGTSPANRWLALK
jgi:hypothetical protein